MNNLRKEIKDIVSNPNFNCVDLETNYELSGIYMLYVEAHFDMIPQIMAIRDKVAPQTLITINGDILDREMGLELAEKYGVDGIMIGRGIFKNPYAFELEKKEHSSAELLGLLQLQLDLQDKYSELVPRSIVGLHRFFKIYVKGFPGASDLRVKLMNTKSTDEVREMLAAIHRGEFKK